MFSILWYQRLFFHITVPAHFSNQWQKYERKIRAQFCERKTRNSIFWKFLGNHMMESFLETICWEILGNYVLGNLGGCWRLF